MNAFQRFVVRAASRLAPDLGRLFSAAGTTVERLGEQVTFLRTLNERSAYERGRLKAELREAAAMAGGVPWSGASATGQGAVVLKERLAELELAMEDRGWERQLSIGSMEFSRWGIQQIILMSRLYFIKNPLIRRGVAVSADYVFGRGVDVSTDDKTSDEVLDAFFHDPRNVAELGQVGLVSKEESLYTDGNIFLAFFTAPDGAVVVRCIDPLEITEIVCDPDDSSVCWYYKRQWSSQEFSLQAGTSVAKQREAWYVAMDYEPPAGLQTIGRAPVERDSQGQYVPILHLKVGGLGKWQYGCPLVYPAIDWARAYREFLEDWSTITRSLARFTWDVETKGGAPSIEAFRRELATTLNMDSRESNPPPTAGSAFIHGPGNKLQPIRTAGATTEPEQGRRVFLMVCAAFGVPETFFGDVSVGTLATGESLDRPTELHFLRAQERWRAWLQHIGRYVLKQSKAAPGGRLREAEYAEIENQQIEVKFAPIVQRSIQEQVSAVVSAMTLGSRTIIGIDEKTGVGKLLELLGVEDVQAVLDEMYPASYNADRVAQKEEMDQQKADATAALAQKAPSKEALAHAIGELSKAAEKLNGR